MTAPAPSDLRVKELAPAIGKTVRYVYEMRRCGFRMNGCGRYNQECTVKEAKDWILKTGFRIIHGRGGFRKVHK